MHIHNDRLSSACTGEEKKKKKKKEKTPQLSCSSFSGLGPSLSQVYFKVNLELMKDVGLMGLEPELF